MRASTWLYLVRHGEVVAAEARRFVGSLDVELSSRGERQMARLAGCLAGLPITAVYASDLVRARRSAEILAAAHDLQVRVDPRLREVSMGRWEGLTAEEIERQEPEFFYSWMNNMCVVPFPGGESLRDLHHRVVPAIEAMLEDHPGGHVLVVAHGGTNRVIVCEAIGVPLERALALDQCYAGLSILERRDSEWMLHLFNDGTRAEP